MVRLPIEHESEIKKISGQMAECLTELHNVLRAKERQMDRWMIGFFCVLPTLYMAYECDVFYKLALIGGAYFAYLLKRDLDYAKSISVQNGIHKALYKRFDELQLYFAFSDREQYRFLVRRSCDNELFDPFKDESYY
jgi:hypothetical protein